MHDSYDACCHSVFFGRECPKSDVCKSGDSITHKPTAPPTKRPVPGLTEGPTAMKTNSSPTEISSAPSSNPTTDQPTFFPTVGSPTSTPTVCKPAKWHPGADGYCSNSPTYNELWNMPALTAIYLHDTHASCCRQFYDKKICGMEDVCANNSSPYPTKYPTQKPTPSKTSSPIQSYNSSIICELKKYHPVSVFDRRCSNDNKFPPLWNIMTSSYFFNSAQECCDSFYSDGWGGCEVEDICTSQERIIENTQNCGKKWHPTSQTYRLCSNGDNYPSVWDSMADQFLFSTAEECCKAFYSDGTGQCDIFNTC